MKNKMKQWRKSAESINQMEGSKHRGKRYKTGPSMKYPFVSDLLRALVSKVKPATSI